MSATTTMRSAAIARERLETVALACDTAMGALTDAERAYPDPAAGEMFGTMRSMLTQVAFQAGAMTGICAAWKDGGR